MRFLLKHMEKKHILISALILALGALGYASMWLAVFADVGVAVIAILNSMRMLRYRG